MPVNETERRQQVKEALYEAQKALGEHELSTINHLIDKLWSHLKDLASEEKDFAFFAMAIAGLCNRLSDEGATYVLKAIELDNPSFVSRGSDIVDRRRRYRDAKQHVQD